MHAKFAKGERKDMLCFYELQIRPPFFLASVRSTTTADFSLVFFLGTETSRTTCQVIETDTRNMETLIPL